MRRNCRHPVPVRSASAARTMAASGQAVNFPRSHISECLVKQRLLPLGEGSQVSKERTNAGSILPPDAMEHQPRRAASIAATSIFFIVHHRVERALGFGAAGRHRLGQHARRDLPGDAPLVLAPAARALLAAVADDGVPVAVGLLLVVGGDLEREGLVVLERRARR